MKLSEEKQIDLTPANRTELLEMLEASSGDLGYGQASACLFTECGLDSDDERRRLWWVHTSPPMGDDRNVVAITGDGPRSEANARFFANAKRIVLSLLERIDQLETRQRVVADGLRREAEAAGRSPAGNALEHWADELVPGPTEPTSARTQ